MRSGCASDARARGSGEIRGARLAGSTRSLVDCVKEMGIDRNVDADGLAWQLDGNHGNDRAVGILDESRIGLQLLEASQPRQWVAVLDHSRDVERQRLGSSYERLVKAGAAGDTSWKIRKGYAVSLSLLMDERVNRGGQNQSPFRCGVRLSPAPAGLAKNRSERANRYLAHARIDRNFARSTLMYELHVIARTLAPHNPSILAEAANDLPRTHHPPPCHRPPDVVGVCIYAQDFSIGKPVAQ